MLPLDTGAKPRLELRIAKAVGRGQVGFVRLPVGIREDDERQPPPRAVIRLGDHRPVVGSDKQRMRRVERDVVLVQIPRLDPADVLDLLDRGDVQRPVLGQLLRDQEPLPPKIGALGRVLGRVRGDEL